ncbi:MAG: single-stranded-DNA-specific exonuclease RecJ [Dehalococcoidales bacterium]|nr:MAG: single-stranded-DNA-specific exonuclease RecJ [Dehalococcoidales bacterium]
MSHSRWNILPPIPDSHLDIADFPRLISQILYNRGLTDLTQLDSFIAADQRLSGEPSLLPGMHQAVARIFRALLSGEKIAVYGDFDTDGITATACMVQGLTTLKGNVIAYIPHRQTEGYGLNNTALENLRQQGVSLVITVDCGITSLPEVKRAKRKGLDIIITDHHTPPDIIPPADAVVDPKLPDSNYPFSELAGVGVAFKLLQALFQGIGQEEQLRELADLVALGTVADMMPLLGENRYLVKEGLRLLNSSPRLAIREMMAQSGMESGGIDAQTISWNIAPRLNAAGRMEHAMGGYRLLLTDSPQEAKKLAAWLEQKNAERQRITTKALTKAKEQVSAQEDRMMLIASDEDYPVGIIGLIAGRLTDEFYRPAIAIRTGNKISTGSCRSIPEFNIIKALTQYKNLFTHFGGHSQAAGFSLLTRNLPHLEEALLNMASTQLEGLDLRPRLDIDAEVRLTDMGGNTYSMIQKLAPFGQGNPEPVFLSRRVEVVDYRTMGNNGEHLRLKLKQQGSIWDSVGFRLGNYLAETPPPLDIVYNLELDRWGGEERLRLNILDFVPSK